MSDVFDIAIVGAGPAGSAVARHLSGRFKVVCIDPAFSGRARQKPCGGLLSEAAQQSLASLGLTLPKEILSDPQCFGVDVFDLERGAVRTRRYARTYTNMDRRAFDKWLRSFIPPSVERITGRVATVKKDKDGYRLRVRQEGTDFELFCSFLVIADGGGSLLRRMLLPDAKLGTYTAVQEHFLLPDLPPAYACFYDRLSTDACGWSLGKDGVFIVGGAFRREGSSAAFSAFKARVFAHYGLPMVEAQFREACPVVFPRLRDKVLPGSGTFALAGEAAGLISASSFEGISFAIESGYLLAEALNTKGCTELAVPAYSRLLRKLRLKVFLRAGKANILNNALLRRIILKSGVKAIRLKHH